MEIHLIYGRGNFCIIGGQFCELTCDQTSFHTVYNEVSNERYRHYIFAGTPKFSVHTVFWIVQIPKVKYIFKKLGMLKKIDQFYIRTQLFERFFQILPFLEILGY